MTIRTSSVFFTGAAFLSFAGLGFWGVSAFERSMVYHPDAAGYFRDVIPPEPWERVEIINPVGGVDIFGWYMPAEPGKQMTLWMHGNADSVDGIRRLSDLVLDDGAGALLMSYRGYAGNPGKPSEEGLTNDALASLAWLAERGYASVTVIAHSLGTGVAAAAAAGDDNRMIDKMILLAPFTDLPSVAKTLMPFLPVNLLMAERYPSLEHLKARPDIPLLIVHGADDRVVPLREGRRLAEELGDSATFLAVEGEGHMPLNETSIDHVRKALTTSTEGVSRNQ